MASDPHDRWLFLLAVAPLPLACADDVPADPVTDGSTGTTAAPTSTTMTDEPDGSTSTTTTGLDGTSSSGGSDTLATDGSSSSGLGSSSSDGTTMAVEPTTGSSSGEGSSSTGEPLGLCELWGENQAACYGYYTPEYFTSQCYDYVLNYIDPMCGAPASAWFLCQTAGCFVDCETEYEALYECNELVEYMELGCDMIPIMPAVGTIAPQCVTFVDQVEVCTAAGFYISGFSYDAQYSPMFAEYSCMQGNYFTNYNYVPQVAGDTCGGAYEELLTCLSALPCGELELAVTGNGACAAQLDAVTCRCELGV